MDGSEPGAECAVLEVGLLWEGWRWRNLEEWAEIENAVNYWPDMPFLAAPKTDMRLVA